MNKPFSIRVEEIYIALKSQLVSGEYAVGEKMPSFRLLAKNYSVSFQTIQKVITRLEHEELITRYSSFGIFAGKKSSVESFKKFKKAIKAIPRHSKAMDIEEYFHNQISEGRIKTGAFLPAMKLLQHQFQSSRNTIEKGLLRLCQKGLVERFGVHYRIRTTFGTFGKKKDARTVIVLGSQKSLTSILRTQNAQTIFQTFEQELQKNISFHIEYISDKAEYQKRKRTFAPNNTVGVVVFRNWIYENWGIAEADTGKSYERLFGNLKVPCAMSFIAGVTWKPYATWGKIPRHVLPMVVDNGNIGKKTGAYLFERGHRRIAFLTLYGKEPWSIERLAGVRTASNARYHIQVYDAGLLHTDTNDIQRRLNQKTDSILHDLYKKNLVPLYPVWDTNPPSSIICNDIARLMETACRLQPAFEELLRDKDITAWITADEYVTQSAVDFLQQNNVRIPQQLSIIGIDSNPFTIFSQVTSYDFDHPTAGYLFAHWLLQDIPIKRTSPNLFEMPGQIIERNSVARVNPT